MSLANVETAGPKLLEEMKVDILTEFQDADNEKTRIEVSKSFTCTSSRTISNGQLAYIYHSGHYNRSIIY